MKFAKVASSIAIIPVLLLSACGNSAEKKDSGDVSISDIVNATCNDLRNATTSAGAAQTLSYSMQLAEAIGVSNTQLGSLLTSTCYDALNSANQLP